VIPRMRTGVSTNDANQKHSPMNVIEMITFKQLDRMANPHCFPHDRSPIASAHPCDQPLLYSVPRVPLNGFTK